VGVSFFAVIPGLPEGQNPESSVMGRMLDSGSPLRGVRNDGRLES